MQIPARTRARPRHFSAWFPCLGAAFPFRRRILRRENREAGLMRRLADMPQCGQFDTIY
jgi:hypothetical protein